MPDRDKVISGLHCRAQDLMIDSPACDGCDYQIQMVSRMGCDFRRLCRDAISLLKKREVVRCKDCAYALFQEGMQHGHIVCTKPFTERWQAVKPDDWFCADGIWKD